MDLAAISGFIAEHPDIRLLFVDDGSSDATEERLKFLCSGGAAEYLRLSRNQGKAEAVRQGMRKAAVLETEYAGFWDADLATPLEELPRMLDAADEGGLIYLSGCRLLRLGGRIQRKRIRHILGRIFATLISIHLNLPIYDTQCGAKLYRKKDIGILFSRPFATRWFFDVEIIKRLEAEYGRTAILEQSMEMPLNQWREIGGSKLRLGRILIDFARLIFCTKEKR